MIQNSKWVNFSLTGNIIQFSTNFYVIYLLILSIPLQNWIKKWTFCKMRFKSLIRVWIQPIWAPNADPLFVRNAFGCQMQTSWSVLGFAQMQITWFGFGSNLHWTWHESDSIHISDLIAHQFTKIIRTLEADLWLSWSWIFWKENLMIYNFIFFPF